MRVVWLGLTLLVASALFAAVPAVDLAASHLFYDGSAFPVAQNRLIEALRLTLYGAEDLAAVLTLGLALVTGWTGRALWRLAPRDWLFSFAVFAAGPGLLVNGILKPLWGRARPDAVAEFGGMARFTPAWAISDQCQADCSFVSGEMAGAVALAVLFGLLARGGRAVWALVWIIPLFTAWQRVAAGRHFLSDVVLSAVMVALIAAVLARLFYPVRAPASAVDFPPPTP